MSRFFPALDVISPFLLGVRGLLMHALEFQARLPPRGAQGRSEYSPHMFPISILVNYVR